MKSLILKLAICCKCDCGVLWEREDGIEVVVKLDPSRALWGDDAPQTSKGGGRLPLFRVPKFPEQRRHAKLRHEAKAT